MSTRRTGLVLGTADGQSVWVILVQEPPNARAEPPILVVFGVMLNRNIIKREDFEKVSFQKG